MFVELYTAQHAASTELRRAEDHHKRIAKALGVDRATLNYWLHKKR